MRALPHGPSTARSLLGAQFIAPATVAAGARFGPCRLLEVVLHPAFGHRITNAWNATVSPASGAVTAPGLAHNAGIVAGASQTFGFHGYDSGVLAQPSGLGLNATSCA
ncbi:cellulose binding domain-containing protein [Streptomyces sp. NPDC060035]|uniref:cellulose binding domain-containing protein n=1 Tax=Streptomyces sp. NPDC060035 TaxID=3347044 RepID=UPI0036B2585A